MTPHDPGGCPPGTRYHERDLADPISDDQVIRREFACVLPDGNLHGPYELRTGGAVTARGTYDHGKRTGMWIVLGVTNGGHREGAFVDDKEEGVWKSFHATDVVAWTGAFKHGRRHGRFEWFTADGAKQQVGELFDDQQDGTWTFYRPDGSVDRTEVWAKGTRVR